MKINNQLIFVHVLALATKSLSVKVYSEWWTKLLLVSENLSKTVKAWKCAILSAFTLSEQVYEYIRIYI